MSMSMNMSMSIHTRMSTTMRITSTITAMMIMPMIMITFAGRRLTSTLAVNWELRNTDVGAGSARRHNAEDRVQIY